MPEAIDQEAVRAHSGDVEDENRAPSELGSSPRLSVAAGLVQLQQFKRLVERPFTAAERGKITILVGGHDVEARQHVPRGI
jgi:hypothetical protein